MTNKGVARGYSLDYHVDLHVMFYLNLLHPKISMYILHTVLYTFPKELTRRICLLIKSFISW